MPKSASRRKRSPALTRTSIVLPSGAAIQSSRTPKRAYAFVLRTWSRSAVEGERTSTTKSGACEMYFSPMIARRSAAMKRMSGWTTSVAERTTSQGA